MQSCEEREAGKKGMPKGDCPEIHFSFFAAQISAKNPLFL